MVTPAIYRAIVGRAAHSNFPSEPAAMIEHIMSSQYIEEFRPNYPFSNHISKIADAELDQLVAILEREDVKVYRSKDVD